MACAIAVAYASSASRAPSRAMPARATVARRIEFQRTLVGCDCAPGVAGLFGTGAGRRFAQHFVEHLRAREPRCERPHRRARPAARRRIFPAPRRRARRRTRLSHRPAGHEPLRAVSARADRARAPSNRNARARTRTRARPSPRRRPPGRCEPARTAGHPRSLRHVVRASPGALATARDAPPPCASAPRAARNLRPASLPAPRPLAQQALRARACSSRRGPAGRKR